MRVGAIGAENYRSLAGETFVELSQGLNVVVGRNNVGKSSLLTAAFWALREWNEVDWRNAAHDPGKPVTAWVEFLLSPTEAASLLTLSSGFRLTIQTTPESYRMLSLSSAPVVRLRTGWSAAPNEVTRIFAVAGGETSIDFVQGACREGLENLQIGSFQFLPGHYNLQNTDNQATIRKVLAASVAGWSSSGFAISAFSGRRRLVSAEESGVKQMLTFLRMKYMREGYEPLARAFEGAFPELHLDFADLGEYEYRPEFRPRGLRAVSLTREAIGSGAWMFLSMLTAIHGAYVQGARFVVLDEPHLYLHPSLERRLIGHLTNNDRTIWADGPPTVVAATHSPEILEAAISTNGKSFLVDWASQNTGVAEVHNVSQDMSRLASVARDLLYARKSVFVEGPSDQRALDVLLPELANQVRYIPLRTPDDLSKHDFVTAVRAVANARAAAPGELSKPLLLIDSDKKESLARKWAGWRDAHPEHVFDVRFVGLPNNDFESLFCDAALLCAFAAREAERALTLEEERSIAELVESVVRKGMKGCVAVEETLKRVGCVGVGKVYMLPRLAEVYRSASAGSYPAVAEQIEPLLAEVQR